MSDSSPSQQPQRGSQICQHSDRVKEEAVVSFSDEESVGSISPAVNSTVSSCANSPSFAFVDELIPDMITQKLLIEVAEDTDFEFVESQNDCTLPEPLEDRLFEAFEKFPCLSLSSEAPTDIAPTTKTKAALLSTPATNLAEADQEEASTQRDETDSEIFRQYKESDTTVLPVLLQFDKLPCLSLSSEAPTDIAPTTKAALLPTTATNLAEADQEEATTQRDETESEIFRQYEESDTTVLPVLLQFDKLPCLSLSSEAPTDITPTTKAALLPTTATNLAKADQEEATTQRDETESEIFRQYKESDTTVLPVLLQFDKLPCLSLSSEAPTDITPTTKAALLPTTATNLAKADQEEATTQRDETESEIFRQYEESDTTVLPVLLQFDKLPCLSLSSEAPTDIASTTKTKAALLPTTATNLAEADQEEASTQRDETESEIFRQYKESDTTVLPVLLQFDKLPCLSLSSEAPTDIAPTTKTKAALLSTPATNLAEADQEKASTQRDETDSEIFRQYKESDTTVLPVLLQFDKLPCLSLSSEAPTDIAPTTKAALLPTTATNLAKADQEEATTQRDETESEIFKTYEESDITVLPVLLQFDKLPCLSLSSEAPTDIAPTTNTKAALLSTTATNLAEADQEEASTQRGERDSEIFRQYKESDVTLTHVLSKAEPSDSPEQRNTARQLPDLSSDGAIGCAKGPGETMIETSSIISQEIEACLIDDTSGVLKDCNSTVQIEYVTAKISGIKLDEGQLHHNSPLQSRVIRPLPSHSKAEPRDHLVFDDEKTVREALCELSFHDKIYEGELASTLAQTKFSSSFTRTEKEQASLHQDTINTSSNTKNNKSCKSPYQDEKAEVTATPSSPTPILFDKESSIHHTKKVCHDGSNAEPFLGVPTMSIDKIQAVIRERDSSQQFNQFENIELSLSIVKGLITNAYLAYDESIHGPSVLVIGNSGCGKSTTVNYLLGLKMVETKLNDGEIVVDVESRGKELTSIGHSAMKSMTMLPQLVSSVTFQKVSVKPKVPLKSTINSLFHGTVTLFGYRSSSKVQSNQSLKHTCKGSDARKNNSPISQGFCFSDFPGFHDSRGAEFNIANAVNLKNFFKATNNVRILFLFDRTSIRPNRGKLVRENVALLNDMFAGHTEQLLPSILVAITKVESDLREDKLAADIDLLCQHFSSCGFVLLPQNVCVIDPLETRAKYNRKNIIDKLWSLRPISSPFNLFHTTLSDTDDKLLSRVLEKMLTTISCLLEDHKYAEISENCSKLKSLYALGLPVTSEYYYRTKELIEARLESFCAGILSILLGQNPGQLLECDIVHDVKLLEQAFMLNECFEDSRVDDIMSKFYQNVHAIETGKQDLIDEDIKSELEACIQSLQSVLEKVDEEDPCVKQICDISNFQPLYTMADFLGPLKQYVDPLLNLCYTKIPGEIADRPTTYCFPKLKELDILRLYYTQKCSEVIIVHVLRLQRARKYNEFLKAKQTLILSIPDCLDKSCAKISYLLMCRFEDLQMGKNWLFIDYMSPLEDFGFQKSDLKVITTALEYFKTTHAVDHLQKARSEIDGFFTELQVAVHERYLSELSILMEKIYMLILKHPDKCLDSKEKTLSVENGLSAEDWYAADEIEKQTRDSKFMGTPFKQFLRELRIQAITHCLTHAVANQKISKQVDNISVWVTDLDNLGTERKKFAEVLSLIEVGISARFDSEIISEHIRNDEYANLLGMFEVISKLKVTLSGYLDLAGAEKKLILALQSSVQELQISAIKDIKDFFKEETPDARFKLKKLKQFCQCVRGLYETSMLSFMEVYVSDLEQCFSETLELCISHRGKSSANEALFIVKFLHFSTNFDDIFRIDKPKWVCRFEAQIKETPDLESLSMHVMNLSAHKDLGAAAHDAVSTFPEFRHIYIQLYNQKAGHMGVSKVLKQLQTEDFQNLTLKQASDLQECYNSYQKTFDDKIFCLLQVYKQLGENHVEKSVLYKEVRKMTHLARQEALRLSRLCRIEETVERNLNATRVAVGELLGNLFFVWSMLESPRTGLLDVSNFTESLLQPHATQIICILRLLGIDEEGPTPNHLAEVNTGEGKSIILGAVSIVFALLGRSINVVCYNPYLLQRDSNLFAGLHRYFNVQSKISYCTIDGLVHSMMKDGSIPNVRQLAKDLLSNKKPKHAPFLFTQSSNVLLIDEVDVFFGPNFFGNCQHTCTQIDTPASQELIQYVFNQRKVLKKKKNAVDLIMKQPFVERLLRMYPGLKRNRLIEEQIENMIKDLRVFEDDGALKHDCHVSTEENNIGYVDETISGVNFDIVRGYQTYFAYLYWCKQKRIDITANKRAYGLRLDTGQILYSELPKLAKIILGVSATVRHLGSSENRIISEYAFKRRSFIPSTFQKNTLNEPYPLLVVESADEMDFFGAIKDDILLKLRNEQTTLVIFDTLEKLRRFKTFLKNSPLKHPKYIEPLELHDEMSHLQRDGVVSRAMGKYAITLMTRTYGRGTDFKCNNLEINSAGGVHVLLTFLPASMSEYIQIQGRTCRQDNYGSFREIFWSCDLRDAGFVKLIDGRRIDTSASPSQSLKSFLDEKRRLVDDANMSKMVVNLERNTKLWVKTKQFIKMAMTSNIDEAFIKFKELQ